MPAESRPTADRSYPISPDTSTGPSLPGPAGLEAPPAPSLTAPGAAASTPPDPAGRPAGRLPSLDGLRGVAALVVVVFHALLLSSTYDDPAAGVRPEDPSWWLTSTPLYLLWAGPQAVFLFFVLSGFVLALPATTGTIRWRAYYPQRLLRLYLPVWASLLLALALATLAPRVTYAQLSDWYNEREAVPGIGTALHDALLLHGTGWLNSPLWSLRYEVLFSLLLPLYLLGGRLLPRLGVAKFVALTLFLGAQAAASSETVTYLSMFAFGVLLAFERERLAVLARQLTARVSLRVTVVGGCLVFLTCEALLLLAGIHAPLVRGATLALQVIGACLAVFLAMHWQPLRAALTRPSAQWLGVRSFSLYLVHEPIIVSLAAWWPQLPVEAHLLLAVPVSLVAAHLFHRAVEGPAHRLSRWAGRRAAA